MLARLPVACLLYKYTSHIMIFANLSSFPFSPNFSPSCSVRARSKHISALIHNSSGKVKMPRNAPPHCSHSIRKTQTQSSRTPCIPKPRAAIFKCCQPSENRNRNVRERRTNTAEERDLVVEVYTNVGGGVR